jgi:DNA-binding HxlR family transcriptional regulator
MIDDHHELDCCPVEAAIGVIGGKWKLLILRHLLLHGPHRFNQLSDRLGVSNKVLSENLRDLQDAELLVHPETGAPYELSPRGAALMPVFQALAAWGAELP